MPCRLLAAVREGVILALNPKRFAISVLHKFCTGADKPPSNQVVLSAFPHTPFLILEGGGRGVKGIVLVLSHDGLWFYVMHTDL